MARVTVQRPITPDSFEQPSPSIGGARFLCADPEMAFATISERYRKRLFHIALRIVKNDADAEDAVQDSLLRAYLKMDGFRGQAGVYTWLVRIVINTSLMILRKRSRHPLASLDWDDGESFVDLLSSSAISVEADAIQLQLRDIMYSAVMDLPLEFSSLMLAWTTQDQSMTELSSQFGITLSATKSRILRGKQKVAKKVKHRLTPRNAGHRTGVPRDAN